jgi:hypothetical protein
MATLGPKTTENAKQERTVTEPQPSPGPVPADQSPPHDKERTARQRVVGDLPGTWPARDHVDPHPLTPEDTRRPEKPAGLSVPSREYGGGFVREEKAREQGKAPGEPPDVVNVPTGAVPVESEDTTGEPHGEIKPPTAKPGTDSPVPPPRHSTAEAPINTGAPAGSGEPSFKATPPTGTSENPDESKPSTKS